VGLLSWIHGFTGIQSFPINRLSTCHTSVGNRLCLATWSSPISLSVVPRESGPLPRQTTLARSRLSVTMIGQSGATMANLEGILQQLREQHTQARAQVQALEAAISALQGTSGAGRFESPPRARRTMSSAARKRIAEAQRRRWAKVRAGASAKRSKGKRTLSPEARNNIIAAQKARWARFRAAKKK
jgi:hypothetical protein